MLQLRVTIVVALVLACTAALAASADVKIEQKIAGYSGDITPNPDPLKACNDVPCAYYCNAKYCAHGNGRVDFHGEYREGLEWTYIGHFVHGRMEGFGTLKTDYFIYEGQFKANDFDGHGAVQCREGRKGFYEGEFAMGRLIGELRIARKAQTVTWPNPGDYVDRLRGPCVPKALRGRASVIDGDTLEVQGERIRILYVDAPESQQTCTSADGVQWRCGQEAARALTDWIGARTTSCELIGEDGHNRWLARCAVAGSDVAKWLAVNGWAVPYPDCPCKIVRDAAEQAKADRRGIWSGSFQMPWDWRKAHQ